MSIYARIQDGAVAELFETDGDITEMFHADLVWNDVTNIKPQPQQRWTFDGTSYAAPIQPAATLAQQAQAMLDAGCQIVSTATPALNGTYAVGPDQQRNLNSMYNLIQRAGGSAFPAGLSSLPWPDAAGNVHVFPSAAEFLAFETAIGDWVLQLNLIVTTNSGELPSATVTIP